MRSALAFASERLRDRDDLVQEAIAQNGAALEYASVRLRNDPTAAEIAVRTAPEIIRKLSPALRANKAVVLAAVAKDGGARCFASPALQADADVLTASAPIVAEWLDPRSLKDIADDAAPCIRKLGIARAAAQTPTH